jgi:hypothetical protein
MRWAAGAAVSAAAARPLVGEHAMIAALEALYGLANLFEDTAPA